jgi:hypothetical protein
MKRKLFLLCVGCVLLALGVIPKNLATSPERGTAATLSAEVPVTWNDRAMAELEVPLADPTHSPKHASADYYYQIPVRPIYKSYPLYAPSHVPPGCGDGLKQAEPVILWDDKGHRPPLKTEADWIKAGEMVFESPILFSSEPPPAFASEFHRFTGRPIPTSGVDPFAVCVVREKGKVEVGFAACADCHTRVMPDGSIIKGAQGNSPVDRGIAFLTHLLLDAAKDRQAFVMSLRLGERAFFEVPWLNPSDQLDYSHMSVDEIADTHAAIPGGVFARQRTSVLYPPHIPDLIGVKDRKYLDATGLQEHRSIVDMMRYAALNQGGDDLASYDGFIPAGGPEFKILPGPDKLNPSFTQPERYTDEQLYALALYLYSLQPPPNPNRFDALAALGEKVFDREGCATCHTPPLYTNNKLTPAEGFTPPPGASQKYDILTISVGTDPGLATKTRRGTGYYKVPSLKGVWYRGMFGHSGWCATLEDWFDPRRTREDYVPTGFKPYGAKTYAVRGHPFGLDLSDLDRKALIAFLKTL